MRLPCFHWRLQLCYQWHLGLSTAGTGPDILIPVTINVNSVPIINPVPGYITKGDVTVELETVLDGLPSPLGMAVADDGSQRMFVFDQSGLVWSIKADGSKSTLLDIRDRLVTLGAYDERGLLGLAAHPNFAQTTLVYTFTSEPNGPAADFPSMLPNGVVNNCQSVLAEWRVDASDPNLIDPSSRREILSSHIRK